MTHYAPCGVRHVRLDLPLETLAPAADERSIYAVFWWKGLPLGERLFTAGELPVPAAMVADLGAEAASKSLAAQLHRGQHLSSGSDLDALLATVEAGATGQTVSLVICTRDRPRELAMCLRSLAALDPGPDEVIVVDNNPADSATRKVVEAQANVRYVPESTPGLSHARNAGVQAARFDIVAFTDDDVEVHSSWLLGLKSAFCDPKMGFATGLVLPAELHDEAAFAFQFDNGWLTCGFAPKTFTPSFLQRPVIQAAPFWEIGAGANMAIRRAAFDTVGLFDTRLGAGASGCSEDSEMWGRLLEAGWLGRYQPAAVVIHHHRNDVSGLRAQMRAYLRGHVVALFIQYGRSHRFGDLFRAFVTLPTYYAAKLLLQWLQPPEFRRKALTSEIAGLLDAPFCWLRLRKAGAVQGDRP